MVSVRYFCQNCKRKLEPNQKPCPFCGYSGRIIEKDIPVKVGIKDSLKARQKRKGYRKFMKEVIQGWFPSKNEKKHPKGVEKTRVIDKEKDRYQEKVKDAKTGEISRNIKEPLSKHRK